MSKSKSDWQEEARALGLEFSEEDTVAQLKSMIAVATNTENSEELELENDEVESDDTDLTDNEKEELSLNRKLSETSPTLLARLRAERQDASGEGATAKARERANLQDTNENSPTVRAQQASDYRVKVTA